MCAVLNMVTFLLFLQGDDLGHPVPACHGYGKIPGLIAVVALVDLQLHRLVGKGLIVVLFAEMAEKNMFHMVMEYVIQKPARVVVGQVAVVA